MPGLSLATREYWRALAGNQQRLGQLRNISVILLVFLLSQSFARFTWALFTPVPEIAPASVAAPPIAAAPARATGAAEATALGENLAALHLFGRAKPQEVTSAPAAALIDAPETTLNLALKGLLATATGERGWAVISEKGRRGQEGVYVVGDQVPGNAAIEAIFVDRA